MNILNTYVSNSMQSRLPVIIILLLLILASFAMTIVLICDRNKWGFITSIIALALALGVGIVVNDKETLRYEIFVSDDSIPYNEFTEHWNVIKNEGMIITAERIDDFPICEHCHTEYYNDFTIFCPNCGTNIRKDK